MLLSDLEPDREGLAIATTNMSYTGKRPPDGRVTLWIAGRPRVILREEQGLRGLAYCEDQLLSNAWLPEQQKHALKNLHTGGMHAPYYFHAMCADDSTLYGAVEHYNPERAEFNPFQMFPAYYEQEVMQWSDGHVSRREMRRSRIASMLAAPGGLLLSEIYDASTPAQGLRIVNVDEHSIAWTAAPSWHWGLHLGGAPAGLLHRQGKLLISCYPKGLQDAATGGTEVAFAYVPWILEKMDEMRNKQDFSGMSSLERIAVREVGYSVEEGRRGLSPLSFRNHWSALRQFLEDRYWVRFAALYADHYIFASRHALYAVPSGADTLTQNHLIWKFRDQIVGLAVVRGDTLRRARYAASIRNGNRKTISLLRAA
ncbi:MAG TPA: hypothetical protein VJK52_01280 [Candidatus Nanoarchaeia archaeon]|nr:hypothetical protein [Candidatus Nanoarchaeia archaeon]